MNLREQIIQLFEDGKLAFKTEKQIFAAMHISPAERKAAKKVLDVLENDGVIFADGHGRYSTPAQAGVITGTIAANARGFAFLIPEDKEEHDGDYFISRSSLHGALDGDRVLALKVRGTEDEASVVKILSRGRTQVAGTFERMGGACYVIPDSAKFAPRIFVPAALSMNAQAGDKVVCRITAYPDSKAPNGKVVEILGRGGDFYAEELSVIRNYGLYEEFPKEVEREAAEAAKEVIAVGRRRDLRGLFTVTIDGEDTRDIDDAVSIERQGENFVLGVHIADVSRYVKRGSKPDREAYGRGTSVYFPDRVLPMLPRSLSNGACSLNQGEDRYALSCIITISPKGERLHSEICESVINSDRRLTYTYVNGILRGEEAADEKLQQMCRDMSALRAALEGRRDRLGNIDLSIKEAHIYVNERGDIVIPDYCRGEAEKIIEQFMICANEAVAERMQRAGVPFMYRVHEQPLPEKVNAFMDFISDMGIGGRVDADEPQPRQFQAIIKSVSGKPCEDAVNKVMLRTMQKARYCESNKGHFGIASGCYCHFTSPIRRYPDLFIHRIIKGVLHGDADSMKAIYGPIAAEEAAHCSQCERNADAAERDVDSLYKVVYMSDHIGEEYPATVSGVTAFGVFAELDNTIEGLIRIERLPGGSYELLEDKFTLLGERTFRLGDRIRVRVDGCDWGNMRPEFSLADEEGEKRQSAADAEDTPAKHDRKKQRTPKEHAKHGKKHAGAHKKSAGRAATAKFVRKKGSRRKSR